MKTIYRTAFMYEMSVQGESYDIYILEWDAIHPNIKPQSSKKLQTATFEAVKGIFNGYISFRFTSFWMNVSYSTETRAMPT